MPRAASVNYALELKPAQTFQEFVQKLMARLHPDYAFKDAIKSFANSYASDKAGVHQELFNSLREDLESRVQDLNARHQQQFAARGDNKFSNKAEVNVEAKMAHNSRLKEHPSFKNMDTAPPAFREAVDNLAQDIANYDPKAPIVTNYNKCVNDMKHKLKLDHKKRMQPKFKAKAAPKPGYTG